MQYKLYALRKSKEVDMTQQDLASLLNIKAETYGKKERSEAKFDIDEMFILANYFNKDISELFVPRQ